MSSLNPQPSPPPEDGADRQPSTVPAEPEGRSDTREGRGEAVQPLDLFTEETVDKLAGGFLAVFEPELVRVLSSLEELV